MKNKSKRWANPAEFQAYALGLPIKTLAKILQRTPRTINDWQTGARPIPAWAAELLRLRIVEKQMQLRQLGIAQLEARQTRQNAKRSSS
ncbi:hypothetical protein LBW59_05715 [Ralstonia solanacearum]|uniref:Helix-turn-helix domain-containing protein n=1 Tax=Ralstonia solanacearum TaxID=305 RepID=A0AAW5ZJD1_RALSL|nr:hypothetical protein [Ralstonia solanacearum]MDB0570273.1 hypothetical protein [Ralstonia solanacearum]